MTPPPMRVPFLRATLAPPEEWVPLLQASYRSARFSNFGPLYRHFSAELERIYASDSYSVVLTANATAGITAALLGLGVHGAVAVPAFTFPATLHAVLAAGCEPVLCDVDARTWEMDPAALVELAAKRRVAAAVHVRSFGLLRDQTPLLQMAETHGVKVVVDAAASLGAHGPAARFGSGFGQVEIVSLHATKVFRIGEGGAIFLPRSLAHAIEQSTNFGIRSEAAFGDGVNAKLDEIRCAIGLATLNSIDRIVARRRLLAQRYEALFSRFGDLAGRPVDPGDTPWQSYPVAFATPHLRETARDRLLEVGIETRRYYMPALTIGYQGLRRIDRSLPCPVSEDLARRMLCFPVFDEMSEDDEAYLFEQLGKTFSAL